MIDLFVEAQRKPKKNRKKVNEFSGYRFVFDHRIDGKTMQTVFSLVCLLYTVVER